MRSSWNTFGRLVAFTKLFAELGNSGRPIGGKARHRALEKRAHLVRQPVAAR